MDIRDIDINMKENETESDETTTYYNLNNSYLRGRAFNSGFSRLRDNDYVSENVNRLKHHTSGINIDFKTNSNTISIKATVDSAAYMVHMTAIGQIGFDLYVKRNEKFVFIGTTKINKPSYNVTLVTGLDEGTHDFRLYFPLYIGVKSAYIGVDNGSDFTFIKEEKEKIVIYGTSISQGGCATRPGMSYTSILDRMLNYEFINLGFSGSAHLEEEMADILNEIPMKYLILEVEANNTLAGLKEKLPKFINKLKIENIILISHFPYAYTLVNKHQKEILEEACTFQRNIEHVTFIDGRSLLAEVDYDEMVDGVHLTDLGFYFVSKGLLEYLK